MPTWIIVSLSIIWFFWTLIEIVNVKALLELSKDNDLRKALGYPPARYTASGRAVTIAYLISTVFFISYIIFS